VRNGQLVAAFEEPRATRGEAHLGVVFADPNPTAREFDELRAGAVHKWMYPINPPEAWCNP
jgi:hypothetical protein